MTGVPPTAYDIVWLLLWLLIACLALRWLVKEEEDFRIYPVGKDFTRSKRDPDEVYTLQCLDCGRFTETTDRKVLLTCLKCGSPYT
jgi:hypothetical protein